VKTILPGIGESLNNLSTLWRKNPNWDALGDEPDDCSENSEPRLIIIDMENHNIYIASKE
jgi:hypothetical protein